MVKDPVSLRSFKYTTSPRSSWCCFPRPLAKKRKLANKCGTHKKFQYFVVIFLTIMYFHMSFMSLLVFEPKMIKMKNVKYSTSFYANLMLFGDWFTLAGRSFSFFAEVF